MNRYAAYWSFYIHQGMLSALTLQGIVGYFRHAGHSLADLSWLSFAMLPWVFKFLWAPWYERHSLSFRGNPYLGNAVLFHGLMTAVLALIALLSPERQAPAIMAALLLLSFFSASHGIYVNGLVITTTNDDNRPYANAAQAGGGYLGWALGSLAFLAIAEQAGWRVGLLALTLLSFLMLLPSLTFHQPANADRTASSDARLRPSTLRRLWPAILLAAIFYIAMRGVLTLQTVILVDQRYSLTALGGIILVYNTAASGAGILVGSLLARKLGRKACLLPVLFIHLAIFASIAACYGRVDRDRLIVLFGLANVAAAMGFVTLYNVLMAMVHPDQPASDYALFQSVDIAVMMLAGALVMQIAHRLTYGPVLMMLAGVAALVIWPVWLLLRRLEVTQPAQAHAPPAPAEMKFG